jgi:hypothetical protein
VVEHLAGKALHDGFCLEMEVADHGVTVPPAEDLDEVVVNFATEEGHGSASAEGFGSDVLGGETGEVLCGSSGIAKGVRDIVATKGGPVSFGSIVGGEGGCVGCVVATVIENAPDGGGDGATEWVSAAAVHQDLVFVCIFLGGEGIGDSGGGLNFGGGGCVEIYSGVIDKEGDVSDPEGGAIRAGACVFARTEEEVETDDDHVCHRLAAVVGLGAKSVFQDM